LIELCTGTDRISVTWWW